MLAKRLTDKDICPSCKRGWLQWERDPHWARRPMRYLRCQSCGDSAGSKLQAWGWVICATALGIFLLVMMWAII